MISKCVGCTLAGTMTPSSKELVYGFPIDGPMNVLHVDDFTVGASINYAGDKGFLIAACGMCTFAVVDPVPELNWTTYAQALSMIMLRFRLAHTIVLDIDSKFYAVFSQSCLLLDLYVHTVGSENHDAIIVERVSRYLNKGLKIFTQERGTPAVSREAISLLIYAWNSCLVPLTDITRSMIVCGRDFFFPIEFSHKTAVKLTSSKQWVDTFSA